MKKLLSVLFCSTLFLSSPICAQTVINGSLDMKKDTTLVFSYLDDKGEQQETVEVKKGIFTWSNPINHPVCLTISFVLRADPEIPYVSLWTEPGTMELKLHVKSLKQYTLSNSKTNLMALQFEKTIEEEKNQMNDIIRRYQTMETSGKGDIQALRKEYMDVSQKIIQKEMAFLASHPESYISAYKLYKQQSLMKIEEFEKNLHLLKGDVLNSSIVKSMYSYVKQEKETLPGFKAAQFEAKDLNGGTFHSSDYIGKQYVILDFWASWCVPCRKSNPHLKELYAKYKDKGLVVICVADNDSNPDAWKAAVEKDGISDFIHLLRGWRGMKNCLEKNDVGSLYGVHTLPTKLIISKDGIILGRYGDSKGEEQGFMDEKLKEIYGF
jgi:thiol-disulfide isomerase/thioredoxin